MLNRMSLTEMARGIQSGQFSPSELLQAHLDEIEKTNPRINAFAERFEDAGAEPVAGPLRGVPVTIKSSFDRRSTVARRLEAAGAAILGRTNAPELLASYETDNSTTGRTNNPLNVERTPGGSSGGEAAAIAGFMSAGGVGSDGGGSIRLPAHFCGIVGLKPTPGRIPATGHTPPICHPGGLLGVAGPMARTAQDVKLLFEVLRGYDWADPFSAPVAPIPAPPAPIRIGVMEQFGSVPVQASVKTAVRMAADLLEKAGHDPGFFAPKGLDRAPNLWSFFFTELTAPFTREWLRGREEEAHWTATEFYLKVKDNPEPTGKQVVENLAARDAMRRQMLEQMRETPVLLSPVCSTTAFVHRQRRFKTTGKEIGLFQAMMPLTWVNLLGFPAISLPITMDEDGLPVGVQLIGRPWEEELLLELAVQMESGKCD